MEAGSLAGTVRESILLNFKLVFTFTFLWFLAEKYVKLPLTSLDINKKRSEQRGLGCSSVREFCY